MNKDQATQHALGYSAGREDVSGVETASPTDAPGFMAFAEAFGTGWQEFNTEKRFMMINARSAYDTWQASGGRTIFRDEMRLTSA